MSRSTAESIKVINRGDTSARKLIAVFGAGIGALAGAGAVKAFNRPSTGAGPSGPGSETDTGPNAGGKAKGPIDAFDREAAGADKGIKAKVIKLGERKGWHWLGRTMQVQERYGELEGNNIASAVALQVFLSLFPMMLVAAAIMGFIIHGSNTDVTGKVINSLGLKGAASATFSEALGKAAESRKATSVLGIITLLWSALGVSSALQFAYNQAWQTSGRGLKDKAVGLGWMGGAAVLLVASAAVTTTLSWIHPGLGVVGVVTGLLVSFALWLFTAKVLPNVKVSWRDLIHGAIFAAIGLEVLKLLGGVWVPMVAQSSSSLYGTIGVVFAVLAWVILFGKLVVYAAVLNVVTYEGKHGVREEIIAIPNASAPPDGDVTRSGRADR